MAARKFLKGENEWMMFMDFWKMCQEYWEPEDNQIYWKNVADSSAKFFGKYSFCPLAKIMALGFISYLEDKGRLSGFRIN